MYRLSEDVVPKLVGFTTFPRVRVKAVPEVLPMPVKVTALEATLQGEGEQVPTLFW